MNEMTR